MSELCRYFKANHNIQNIKSPTKYTLKNLSILRRAMTMFMSQLTHVIIFGIHVFTFSLFHYKLGNSFPLNIFQNTDGI